MGGKCRASSRIPKEITVCSNCLYKSVCGDKDYLSQNHCCNFADAEELATLRTQLAEVQREQEEKWVELASDNTGYELAYADGIYTVTVACGCVICEFIRRKEPDNAEN